MKKEEIKRIVRDLITDWIADPDQHMSIRDIKSYLEEQGISLSVWCIFNWKKELLEWAMERWKKFESMKYTVPKNDEIHTLKSKYKKEWLETKKEFKENAWEISVSRNSRITSLEELIEHCCIDLSMWDIDKHVINKRDVGTKIGNKIITEPLYQIKAWLKKKTSMSIVDMERHTIEYLSVLGRESTEIPEDIQDNWERLLEVCIFDAHINKLCLAQKSGNDWNHNIAKQVYLEMIDKMVYRWISEWCTRSVFIVGNDFFQTDTLTGTTTAWTHVSESLPLEPSFVIWQSIIIAAIQKLLELWPVDVVMVGGNHDRAATYFLGQVLSARYKDVEEVTINNSMKTRKYYHFGRNLLMFAHWDQEKIKTVWSVMALEAPNEWANSDYREVHLGHYHTQQTYEAHWVIVRYLNSISWTDDWHHQKSFVWNVRWGTAFVWDRENGMQGQFIFNI